MSKKVIEVTDWHPVSEEAPEDKLLLLGTESDPAVDDHMFFIDVGWRAAVQEIKGAFRTVNGETIFPSHWAPITSPVEGAMVTVSD